MTERAEVTCQSLFISSYCFMRLSARELILKVAKEINAGDGIEVRWQPFLKGALMTSALFFGLALLYITFTPRSYPSSWSLILPGDGVSSKFSLDEIGQASTSSRSPYSSSSLSPKVNYKSILTSRNILKKAAARMGIEVPAFGKPKVRLVQQTSLIDIQITGRSPEMARQKAWKLHETFSHELDRLRRDEINRRAEAVKTSLARVKANLDRARDQLTAFKIRTGLSSLGQFNSTIRSLEKLRAERISARAELKVAAREVRQLGESIGLDAEEASTVLQLNSDMSYKAYAQAYARAKAEYAVMAGRYGRNNINLVAKKRDLEMTHRAIINYLAEAYPDIEPHFRENIFTLDSPEMEKVLKRLVFAHARLEGLKTKVAQLKKLIAELEQAGSVNNTRAARLEELEREHKIAKAVFASALARMDSSQVDPFASYPLVQMLSKPTLPEKPSSPHVAFALAGAFLASLLSGIGWVFAWFHKWFLAARRKAAIQSGVQKGDQAGNDQGNPYLEALFERLGEREKDTPGRKTG